MNELEQSIVTENWIQNETETLREEIINNQDIRVRVEAAE